MHWISRGVVIAILLALAVPAHATTVTFQLNLEFSGGTAPEGPAPWLTVLFDDTAASQAGFVRMTPTAGGLTDAERVVEWYFNVDPALDATRLDLDGVNLSAANSAIAVGNSAFAADGGGSFDIRLTFGPNFLTDGESLIYDVGHLDTALTANSFNFLSVGGVNGSFHSAALIEQIGANDSGSGYVGDAAAVAEPATLVLLGAGLLAAAGLRAGRRS